MSAADNIDISFELQQLYDNPPPDLTGWEIDFIDSLIDVPAHLWSEKQVEKANEILERVG